jgi:hypothetical protein
MPAAFSEKIRNRETGILTYGITPPKLSMPADKKAELAAKQFARIASLGVDALIVYDLQDEEDRNAGERPFPYLETEDPAKYMEDSFSQLRIPKIIYRCVGKYTGAEMEVWVHPPEGRDRYSVFVGAASSRSGTDSLKLPDAYRIAAGRGPGFTLGGIIIPERHAKKGDEHLRVLEKTGMGCEFFVSQAVFHIEAAKNFLSDYYYHCLEASILPVPMIFTVTPCGSPKTLEFLKWLGIFIPRWMENDLLHSEDILGKSLLLCEEILAEIWRFSNELHLPVGFNIESVSTRKVEIDAATELVQIAKRIMGR